jgi:hypothetical protein
MAIHVATINDPAMARNEEGDMGPPPAKRALNAASPHRRMRRRSDFAKEMRPPGFRVEGGLGFPVDPTDIVLLGRQLERL